jgi:hypothetical protein
MIIASVASTIWQTRGGRADRFQHAAEYGFFAGHLGFRPTAVGGDLTRANFRSLELPLQVIPRSATPLVQTHTVRLRLDLLGRLEDDSLFDLPPSGVDTALGSRPATRPELLAFERLSDQAVASAAVELHEPLSVGDFHGLLRRHGLLGLDGEGVGIFLESPDAVEGRMRTFRALRVGWPNPFVAQFQAWTKGLRGGDDRILERLGLPSSRELLELAADPGVHGFVIEAATPRQLRGLRSELAVATISLGDVAFDFGKDR